MINVFQPALGEEELEAVRRVFASNWAGKGKVTYQFEEAFAKHLGVDRKHIVSVNSCTEGLFQLMEMLVGEGDEVILPTISFVGAANAIVAAGARPVFCDVDGELNFNLQSVIDKITSRTKAVIVLHYGGVPSYSMEGLKAVCKEKGIKLIEDSACSVASKLYGESCGTTGDFGVWSFDSMKILVCGDGGMVYCKDPAAAESLRKRMYLGMDNDSGLSNTTKDRWWEFGVTHPGRRSIMNDISSAIGLEQLRKLPFFIRQREMVALAYRHAFKPVYAKMAVQPALNSERQSSYYLFPVFLRSAEDRDGLARHLKGQGIYTTFRYHPLHQVSLYNCKGSLPMAELKSQTTLCLPLHHSLNNADVDAVIHTVLNFFR